MCPDCKAPPAVAQALDSFREHGLEHCLGHFLGHLAMPQRNLIAQRLKSRGDVFFQGSIGKVRVLGCQGKESAKGNQLIDGAPVSGEVLGTRAFEQVVVFPAR